eukprot:360993-Chlamydomonas_euryale.AAC.3
MGSTTHVRYAHHVQHVSSAATLERGEAAVPTVPGGPTLWKSTGSARSYPTKRKGPTILGCSTLSGGPTLWQGPTLWGCSTLRGGPTLWEGPTLWGGPTLRGVSTLWGKSNDVTMRLKLAAVVYHLELSLSPDIWEGSVGRVPST